MFINLLWIIYYRLQCMKVTVNAIFYFFITFKLLISLDNVVRLVLWILLFSFMTPFELIVAMSVDIMSSLSIAPETCAKIRNKMERDGKTKEDAKKEFYEYEEFIFRPANKK